jgi:hypothetical protein
MQPRCVESRVVCDCVAEFLGGPGAAVAAGKTASKRREGTQPGCIYGFVWGPR